MKQIWLIILILFLIPSANAVYLQNALNAHPSNILGTITIAANQNFSVISLDPNYLYLNTTFQMNSSANTTISSVLVNTSQTIVNWTQTQVSGADNFSIKMLIPNYTYPLYRDNIFYQNITSDSSGFVNFSYSDWSVFAHSFSLQQNIALYSPSNNTTTSSTIVNLIWVEDPANIPFTYQLSTDSGFLNVISSGSGSSNGTEGYYQSGNITLSASTTYYWRVKDTTGGYTQFFQFTTGTQVIVPGQLNISVFDEQNHSIQILNYTIQLQNSTFVTTKSSNSTTGWTNFSGAEVITGQYLAIAMPGSGYTNYYQRMVLVNSPQNVSMYLPNSTGNTIDIVSFSLLDVTGRFPYTTSTITINKSGTTMDSSYFSADAAHAVYLIQGNSYQITIQNGNAIDSFGNYIPTGSGTSTITINSFAVNTTAMSPLTYNITYNPTSVTLNWNDSQNVMNIINFTVYKNITSPLRICSLLTSLKVGQYNCAIDNTTTYSAVLSILMNDGTYRNTTIPIDYTNGYWQGGVNSIDNSPMGTGFNFSYGTFTLPQYWKNLASLFLFIILLAEFGAYYSGLGSIISIIILLLFELLNWFVPAGSGSQGAVELLTGALGVFAVIYYLQHKDTFRLGG